MTNLQPQKNKIKELVQDFAIDWVNNDLDGENTTGRAEFVTLALKEAYQLGQQDMLERARGVVLSWKNEGDDPTETDLVLENILKALDNLTK